MSEGTLKANSYGNLLFRPLYWLGVAVWFLFKVLLTAWGTLAIYHSNLPWFGLRLALAAGFAAFSIWALWLARRNSAWLAFAVKITAHSAGSAWKKASTRARAASTSSVLRRAAGLRECGLPST